MVAALSPDIRWRIIWKRFETTLTLDGIADHLMVKVRSVSNYLKIFWLPAYSPSFNPIEAMFGQLKAWFARYFHWCCADTERAIEWGMKRAVSIRVAVRQYEKSGYLCSPEAAVELAPYVQGDTTLYG